MSFQHPGTDIEFGDNIPMSQFRNAIPNSKRYMKHNTVSISHVSEAAYTGDYSLLDEMLATGTEKSLYNGDLNAHVNNLTVLQMAAMTGQVECVELLLKAKADPHVRERMAHGQDPEDGRTALDLAKEAGQDEVAGILAKAEKQQPYGFYMPAGKTNNAKVYVGFQWGSKPAKGWYSSRPGAAELAGFDPMKYGTGPLKSEEVYEEFMEPEPVAGVQKAIAPAGPPLLPIGLLFPGQGSQYVKMMSTVKDIPKVIEMCKTAQSILGWDILDLCLNGPDSKLDETRYCQPAMFLAGLAGLEKLRRDKEEAATQFKVAAGLSLGEYTALCAVGVITFEDGLRLVKMRGEFMQEAAKQGKQIMLSVAGLEKGVLVGLCEEARRKEGSKGICQISNELFPKGYSCGGTEKAVLALKDLAEKKGALQAKVLKTSGAFHTPLMAPAREKLGKALDELLPKMQPPRHFVYMNANAQPIAPGTDPKEIVELLKVQLTSPVLWEQSVRAMIKSGITEYHEVGPMKQLKAMMKRIDPKIWNSTTNVEV